MRLHTAWAFLTPYHCLDEEFDAPDVAADHDLCCALAAGTRGLHPDAWGNHDPLPLRWLLRARPDVLAPMPARVKPTPRMEVPPPLAWARPRSPPPPAEDTILGFGWLQLTCDECGRRAKDTLRYPAGQRPDYVMLIRKLGCEQGWTCIVGRDRCPECSALQPAAPEAVGNGAGEGDRHE